MKSHRGLVSIFGISLILIILASGFFLMGVSRADSDASVQGKKATGKIALHAAGRGNPWINLRDGVELSTAYTGQAGLKQVLEQNLASPTALASADFDEDGVPDLVSGYVGPGGGILTLHRGNVDSVYPNSLEAQQRKAAGEFTDSPFLSPARVFEMPEAPDFLGAGDFDADGHRDIVAATRGSKKLYWLPGDGRGSLGTARHVDLPGVVTALITGEINRRDGLTDVVVGTSGSGGPEVLVFEWPEGALRGEPEVFATPAEVRALALGQLDEHYCMDLAVAAGSEVVIVHGRDRKLSLDEIRRAEVLPATIDQLSFPFAITSLAVGDFVWEEGHRLELALLADDGTVHLLQREDIESETVEERKGGRGKKWKSVEQVPVTGLQSPVSGLLIRTHVSSLPIDDLVVADPAKHKLHIVITDTANISGHRSSVSGAVTLDLASPPVIVLPMRLNADALSDLVILRKGSSTPSVTLTAPMITITVNSTGDGQDRCGQGDGSCSVTFFDSNTGQCVSTGECTYRAAIEEANARPGADLIGFNIPGMGPHTIQPTSDLPPITDAVTTDGTTEPDFTGTPVIELDGSLVSGNGITLTAGNTTVRGLAINRFRMNIFGGLGDGIRLGTNGGNVIEGNFIGADVTGTVALGNVSAGVRIESGSSNNTIGGTAAAARNIISGNGGGMSIKDSGTTGNVVQGNYIGTDVTGTVALGNKGGGVSISRTSGNTLEDNLISDSRQPVVGFGVAIGSGTGNLVQGNLIGTDVTGTVALGNASLGVFIDFGPNNTIGGTTEAARNVISGNGFGAVIGSIGTSGIRIVGIPATGNLVQGNFIGTDVTGTIDLGNKRHGVHLQGPNNTIGGATGMPGTPPGNLISGNDVYGVFIEGNDATGNQVQGNLIGTDVTGTVALGNNLSGVSITGPNNTIGGAGPGESNVIAFNGIGLFADDGVAVAGGTGNAILSNSTFSNADLGIDLPPDGVTPNDTGDGDGGPNNLQNFPEIISAEIDALGDLVIQYSVDSAPGNSNYGIDGLLIQLFKSDAGGEGQVFLGSDRYTVADFNNGMPGQAVVNVGNAASLGVSSGDSIVATATDADGNTSEFTSSGGGPGGSVPVEVSPNQAPVALCLDVTKSADSNCQASVTPGEVNNGSFDPDGDPITLSLDPPGPFPLGMTTVMLTVTDVSGASDSCTATVTVVDDTPPAVTCGAGTTALVNAGAQAAIPDVTGSVTASDNCGATSITQSPVAGALVGPGTHTITVTVTDVGGNTSSCQTTFTVVTIVAVDIKPGSCPNPLNVKSQGVLPVAIAGTTGFNVTDVDPASVRLEGVAPLRSNLGDVATPFSPFTGKTDCNLDCTDLGADGFLDLSLKFDRQEVLAALGAVSDGDCLLLQLTGNLLDGTEIVGEDVVIIKKKGK